MIYALLTTIILALVLIIFLLRHKPKPTKGKLSITSLSEQYKGLHIKLLQAILPPKTKLKVNFPTPEKIVYVIEFKGTLQAPQVENLRQEISAILSTAGIMKPSEVIVKLDSPGGTVTGYGLAAAQLSRLRKAEIPLTVIVDQVAASGGYMMASVANKIIAAPFAIIGSVGVAMEFPNFANLFNKLGVKYLQYTAGEFKRTVSPMVEPTPEGETKTKERLAETLTLFKEHIKQYRPQVDVEKIATGETWYSTEAQKYNLIDEVSTYDDYLNEKIISHDVFKVEYKKPEPLSRRLSLSLAQGINLVIEYWLEKIHTHKNNF